MKLLILILLCSYLFVCHVTHVSATTSQPPRNIYTVTNGNDTCVVMTAGLELIVPYTGNDKNYTATMVVPSTTYVNGSCGRDTDTLNLYYNNSWILSFTFTNSSKKAYQMDSVQLNYAANSTWFPNISSASVGHVYLFTHLPNGTNEAPVSGSYQCQGQSKLALNGSITLNIYDLQYRAFGQTNNSWFPSNNIQQCLQSTPVPESDLAAAVSVGIALAVMIVLVVLFYIVFTKVKGHKYGYTSNEI